MQNKYYWIFQGVAAIYIYIDIYTSIIFLLEGFVGNDLVRAEDPHPVVTFFTPEFAGMMVGSYASIWLVFKEYFNILVTEYVVKHHLHLVIHTSPVSLRRAVTSLSGLHRDTIVPLLLSDMAPRTTITTASRLFLASEWKGEKRGVPPRSVCCVCFPQVCRCCCSTCGFVWGRQQKASGCSCCDGAGRIQPGEPYNQPTGSDAASASDRRLQPAGWSRRGLWQRHHDACFLHGNQSVLLVVHFICFTGAGLLVLWGWQDGCHCKVPKGFKCFTLTSIGSMPRVPYCLSTGGVMKWD